MAARWHSRLGAFYVKMREGGRIISRAVVIAVAVDADGKRQVPGIANGPLKVFVRWPLWIGLPRAFLRTKALQP